MGFATNANIKAKRRDPGAALIDWRDLVSGPCAYCGKTGDTVSWDHIIPLSRNGPNTITNLVPCCLSCNRKKGAL